MPTMAMSKTEIHYAESGGGDPVVLIHGSASDHRTWRYQLPEFAKEFRVVSYSRRYHWPNAAISATEEYSMQRHVDDLVELLTRLATAPAHLVRIGNLTRSLKLPGLPCYRTLPVRTRIAVQLFKVLDGPVAILWAVRLNENI